MRILDLGCGRGSGTIFLKKKFNNKCQVYGVDIDKKNISLARDLYGSDCKFVLAKGEKLPFKNCYFDAVYSREVLEHVVNLDKTLSEIKRILKTNGVFVATFPNKYSEDKLILLNKHYLKEIGHRRVIVLNKFIGDAERYGFLVERVKKYNSVEHLFWEILFKKGYKIVSENGDVNRPIPRYLVLFEELFNPDKKDPGKNNIYRIIRALNLIFSKFSFVMDLFLTKKRVAIFMKKL
jgi:ubiquinone/menaquinone biosynthesis C-methylase UbiE